MTEQQLLTAKQLGLALALSTRQIFRLNSCGKLPRPVRIGGAVRWRLVDIGRWQDLQCPDRKTFELRTQKAGAGV
jgi:predicted DNA-binding transcriptional regulator AlpA